MHCCPDSNKINYSNLNKKKTGINWSDCHQITDIILPRVYTNTHDDASAFVYLGVGHEINSEMFLNDEVRNSSVTGEWFKVSRCESKSGYVIYLNADMTLVPPFLLEVVNKVYCEEMNKVLQLIGIAEYALVKDHPKLAKTPIYINFKSNNPVYNRVECWGTLGYWLCKC